MEFKIWLENEQESLPRTIVADPPWDVKSDATAASHATSKARPQKYYPTMSIESIKSIRPPAAPQAHLWLWVVNQHIDWGAEVARAWGFPELVQMITWAKPGLGAGQFQSNTEHCMLFRRGGRKGNAFGRTVGTYFHWPRGRHSAKPDGFYELVQRVSPGPYLELFARQCRPGWKCMGNEVSGGEDIRNMLPTVQPDSEQECLEKCKQQCMQQRAIPQTPVLQKYA